MIADPRELARWSGMKLFSGPARPMVAGDVAVLGAGPLRMTIQALDAKCPESLRLHVRFTFGIVNHEHIQITAVDASACRVTFH